MSKKLKPTKTMLDDAAFRAGELNVKMKGITRWMQELQEQHAGYSYDEVYNAYRYANPNDRHFAKSRRPIYEEALANTAKIQLELGSLEKDRHVSLYQLREHILQHILATPISAVNEKGSITAINPALLKIFQISHEDLYYESSKHTHTATDKSDTETDRDSPIAEEIKVLQESLADDESE